MEALVTMALNISKKIRSRLLIICARLLRVPVAIHQSFFIAYPAGSSKYLDIAPPAANIPSETG